MEKARAQEIDYAAARDTVAMRGSVQVTDATGILLADRVEANQVTGDSVAEGNVRVSYLAAPQGGTPNASTRRDEPLHVLAARAVSHKSSGLTEFTAAPGEQARMWQAGSAVQAPLLDFDRTGKTVTARNGVIAILTGAQGDPVRVTGSSTVYRDAARTLEIAGPVRVVDAGGIVTSKAATVYLLPVATPAKAPAANAGLLGGKVERVVATGAVVVEQPGRRATGERLLYTAADETFLLTGSPRLVDAERGTVTGASLRFKRGDESVVVSGEGGRVKTETQIKQ